MNTRPPVEWSKGRGGEKIFAFALFLTLIAAAAVAWFVVGPTGEDAAKAFQKAHEGYVRAADDAITRLSIDFEYLAVQCATSVPTRIKLPSEAGSIKTVARDFGVFDANGKSILPAVKAFAPRNPALQSAQNSPYRYDILYARSPFTGEKAVLFTAAFEDAKEETFVLVMEAEAAPLASDLLSADPERSDTLLLVAQDGHVIASDSKRPTINNLINWVQKASPREPLPHPFYVSIRDRIAGFSTFDREGGAFRLGFSPVSGTDWMLAQVEFVE